jgi:soluble lytic murein transglycosylase-like protein
MVTSLFNLFKLSAVIRNNTLRSCLILMLAMFVFAASPVAAQQGHMTTVVKADAKSGRLVRSIVMEPGVIASQNADLQNQDLKVMIDRIADEQGVESQLVHSVIRAESNYNSNAVSPKGAQGIMQLIPATAHRFGVTNTFDPRENIQGGVRYLRFLLDYYKGDYAKSIAAYNAGEGAVDKYNGVPPYAETQNYVYRVAGNLKAARQAAVPRAAVKASLAAVINETETPQAIQTSTGADGRIYYRTP